MSSIENNNVQTVELEEPIKMGDTEITKIELRKPNVQALLGLKTQALLEGDVSSLAVLLPRITTPTLTKAQVMELDPSDLAQCSGVVFLFLQPKSIRTQILQQM